MIVACRAYGLRPIDGPFGDFKDPDGFRRGRRGGARRSASKGKWAIHPSQIALANEVFTPAARRGRAGPADPGRRSTRRRARAAARRSSTAG